MHRPRAPFLTLALIGAVLAGALAHGASGDGATEPVVQAELRSFVIAGRGRHLFLSIDAPEPFTTQK